MKRIVIIFYILTLLNCFNVFSQEKKKEYSKFVKNGIEYLTDGKDTLCVIDPMPEFPGGKTKLIEFISKNVVYPRKAYKEKVEGTVLVRFVVGIDGEIRDIVLVQSVRDDLDKEAIRVIKKMPKWKPGEQNGKPLAVQYTIPIVFKI